MDNDEAQVSTLNQIHILARLTNGLPVAEVEQVLRTAEQFDTIAPIIDPTAWIKTSDNVAANAKLIRAFLDWRRVVAEVVADAPPVGKRR